MSKWYSNAIFYELYLRAFADGNNDGHSDFTGLLQKLDYLKWLGVDCIWLLPMYRSPLKDDGYDVASYYNIHPQYGLLEDFKMALDEIHSKRYASHYEFSPKLDLGNPPLVPTVPQFQKLPLSRFIRLKSDIVKISECLNYILRCGNIQLDL